MALGLIRIRACRAVYAKAGGADNPRYIMEGTGYALGASAFGGIGLVPNENNILSYDGVHGIADTSSFNVKFHLWQILT